MNKLLEKGLVDLWKQEVPKGYQCSQCRATNCKLWRHRCDCCARLLCADCTARDQGEEIGNMNADGCRPSRVIAQDNRIGSFVPALPDYALGGYLPDLTAPLEEQEWWRLLPNREQRR